jgi:hypothetical protein
MEKTKFDRVKETIRLLKALQGAGISDSNGGYEEIKEKLDLWIETGEAAEYEIPLRTYRRKAILTLPKTADRAAEIILRAV